MSFGVGVNLYVSDHPHTDLSLSLSYHPHTDLSLSSFCPYSCFPPPSFSPFSFIIPFLFFITFTPLSLPLYKSTAVKLQVLDHSPHTVLKLCSSSLSLSTMSQFVLTLVALKLLALKWNLWLCNVEVLAGLL